MTQPLSDLEALAAAAGEATPGPWLTEQLEQDEWWWSPIYVGPKLAPYEYDRRGALVSDEYPEIAAFIAACDPTTILALLARLRALEAAVGDLWASVRDHDCDECREMYRDVQAVLGEVRPRPPRRQRRP